MLPSYHQVRYLAVGILCAAVHNAVVIGGAQIGLHYIVSAAVSYAVVVVLGYGLHVTFTYAQRTELGSFVRYALSMSLNLPLTVGLLFVLCGLIRLPMFLASPAATALMLVWNYAASRWAIMHLGLAAQDHGVLP